MTESSTGNLPDVRIDARLVLSALWIAVLFSFAYVDIVGFYRADVLRAALDGTVAGTAFAADQRFLASTLLYILVPTLMVVLSLLLRPAAGRIANVVVSVLYAISIVVSCIGEHWVYYVIGSSLEAVLLAAILRVAWRWPSRPNPSGRRDGTRG